MNAEIVFIGEAPGKNEDEQGLPFVGAASVQGKRIATTYPHIVRDYLRRQGIAAEVVPFSGAVEIAPSLGKADLICDLVSSGATLRANHMVEAETILESRAGLIQTMEPLPADKQAWVRRLLQRVERCSQDRIALTRFGCASSPRVAHSSRAASMMR